jgi:GT2 family glycosyltransferase/glycosyltransferase involved in cell wall biosynthesis
MSVWESVADRILGDIRPSTILHVGCGAGFLVGALRQRGADAFGVDLSEHAIQHASPDVRPFCWQQSPTEPLPRRYDLIVCTDPLQELSSSEVERTIETLCRHSDDILFVPLTAAGREDPPLDLRSPAFWAELFAQHGFYRDVDSDASSIEPQALRFRRTDETPRVVAAYEHRLLLLQREAEARRDLNIEHRHELMDLSRELATRVEVIDALRQQLRDWETRWTALENSMGWMLLERLQRLRARLAPPASRRDQLLEDMWRAIQMRQVGPFVRLVRSTRQQISWVLKASLWRLRLRADLPLLSRLLQVEPVEPRAPVQVHEASVDIIVCVHNALSDVQRCLQSVMEHTSRPYSLILVDDGSGAETRDYLATLTQTHAATLLRNEDATGYTRAANQGLRQSSADYVVLLNSDTVVTPQWLDRLVACAESAPDIGLVGPLSNTASWQSIPRVELHGDWAVNPLPEGLSVEEMGQLVAQYSARLYPTMPFLNGFCLLVRRQVIDEVGIFDEVTFGEGYGEENDFILRARKAGWRPALADDVYVYHAQSRSYSTTRRKRLSEQADIRLAQKHDPKIIREGVVACQQDRVLEGIRARSQAMLAREKWTARGREAFSGQRLLFVLPIAEPGGGGNVVIDEARAMQKMGIDVSIFNLTAYRERFERAYPALGIRVVYGERSQLASVASSYDAVIATYNLSVPWLASIARFGRQPVRGYYVQDFEPYMYPSDAESHQRALESYTLLPDLVRFTKTDWTRREVLRHTGADCSVAGVSVNIDLFRPRPRSRPQSPNSPLTIAAMIRPGSPYREPRLTMEVLRRTSKRYRTGVEIKLFGTTLNDPGFAALPRDFSWVLAGVLNPRQVAQLLNEADIFVDFSSHQAMGLTALEAMACGAATTVPKVGGAIEFARHEENCLVVDTSSVEACWQGLERLIEEHDLRARLQRHALTQVCDFFPERPAFNILKILSDPAGSAAS